MTLRLPHVFLAIMVLTSFTTAAPDAAFGSCSTPEIKFAAGLDGRTETAFAPVDLSMSFYP